MSSDDIETPVDPYAALRLVPFRNYQVSRFILVVAIQMAETVIGYRLYESTKDKWTLGFIALSEVIPFILTLAYSGHAADTFNRYRIVRKAIMAITFCFLAIGLLMSGSAPLLALYGAIPIYFIISVSGVARAFMAPSQQGIFPQLLPRSLYANGATWGSNIWQTAAVAGPALGGLVYGAAGIEVTFIIVVSLLITSYLLFVRVPVQETPPKEKSEGMYQSLTAGLRFVFNKQEMLAAISLDLFAVLFGGAVGLLAVFAQDILKVGPEGFGVLRAAPFLGSIGMGFYLAYHPPMKHAGRNMLVAVAGFGLAIIGFALSENYILSFVMLLLMGSFDNVSVVIRQTIIQTMTPDNMRGRVSAVNQVFIASSNEIGTFESVAAAELMGLVPSVIFGGTVTLLVVAGTYILAPRIRTLRL